jgi:hypothetical protein
MTLKGGQEGTVFKSLTVEGEDRIHLDIARPDLDLDLDPAKAPGLEWGTARDVLDRTLPDFASPFSVLSARDASPYLARPWLSRFTSGPIARFEPDVSGVERWKLLVVDAHGQSVATFEGHGEPPKTIEWDGRCRDGGTVRPGLTYSYVFEAHDRAGNQRHFVGQGFSVGACRLEGPNGPVLTFSGRELEPQRSGSPPAHEPATPAIVLEAASWLNQSDRVNAPLRITATARTYDRATGLARSVASMLTPLLIGDPARVQAVTAVAPDAPEDGTIEITRAR